MDNASEVIQHQMETTRTALQDKLETLEQQVKSTVQEATEAVSDTVDNVKETVQSVKDSLDLSQHVQAHPLAMFLGATAVGFLATQWLMRPSGPAPSPPSPRKEPVAPQPTRNGAVEPDRANTAAAWIPPGSNRPEPGPQNWIADHYHEELAKLKGLAVGTIGGLVRELLTSSAAPAMAEQITEVVNGITVKMGGHLMESPIFKP